jgi:hypothetical protein
VIGAHGQTAHIKRVAAASRAGCDLGQISICPVRVVIQKDIDPFLRLTT